MSIMINMQEHTTRLLKTAAIIFSIVGMSEAEVVNTYYPLHVGDRWVYETVFSKNKDTSRKQEVVVEDRELQKGEYVYKVRNESDSGNGSYWWVRVTDTGEVLYTALGTIQGFVLLNWAPPFIMMPGKADEVGRTWDVVDKVHHTDYPDSLLKVVTKYLVVSVNDTVVVPAGVFRDCIKVKAEQYEPDGSLSRTFTTWYAPYVGKIASFWDKPEHVSSWDVLVKYDVKNSKIRPAPDCQLTNVDGKIIALSDFKGYVVVLGFWSTMIEKSVDMLPFLRKLHEEYHGKAFSVISISTFGTEKPDDSIKLPSVKNNGFIHFIDKDDSTAGKFELKQLPGCYVIDKKGLIRYSYDGLPDLSAVKRNIEDLLME